MISRNQGCSLFAETNITDLLPIGNTSNFHSNRGGVRKVAVVILVQKLYHLWNRNYHNYIIRAFDWCTGSRLMNALNINSCHAPTKFLQPANLTTYTILSLFSLQVELAPRLCHPISTMYLPQYKSPCNRSFTYASPYLWNQLPSSFRQPHSVHCPPGSPHPFYTVILRIV